MTRTYERTHPWLTFRADLKGGPPELWMLLGEAASKIEHVAGVPLKPMLQDEFNQMYLAKGVLATTAIEGNTLSEEEVRAHIRGTLKLPRSKAYLAREVDNILKAVNTVWEDDTGAFADLHPALVRDFNQRALDGLDLDEGVVPGQIRTYSVGVGSYRAAPHEDCEYLLERLCEWLHGPDFETPEDKQVATAILKAIIAHLYLAWIHPFGDGNGRTARLVEFQILVHSGVPMPSAHLLSNHYNATRTEYYRQLDRASRSGGDILPFIVYAVRGFVDELRSQLHLVRAEQWSAAWRDYVHEHFEERRTQSDQRRLRLVLDLSEHPNPVPRSKLREVVSPRLADAYANKTGKTLSRDLNALKQMGLVRLKQGGYVANRRLMLAFRPMRKRASAAASAPVAASQPAGQLELTGLEDVPPVPVDAVFAELEQKGSNSRS